MKTVMVLAGHGMPPSDFPKGEAGELFSLHGRIEAVGGEDREELIRRHDELHAKMRNWERNPENDPFHYSTLEIARALSEELGVEVPVGYNEFWAPNTEEAIDQAVELGVETVVFSSRRCLPPEVSTRRLIFLNPSK